MQTALQPFYKGSAPAPHLATDFPGQEKNRAASRVIAFKRFKFPQREFLLSNFTQPTIIPELWNMMMELSF